MREELRIFGIRHHGPGSATALKRALQVFRPDCLLVEAPEEATPLFPQLLHPQAVLPLALLLYEPARFEQASYLPFAEFSPELQALRYGLQQEIAVRAIDLPAAVAFGHPSSAGVARLQQDPMHHLAVLAGFDDSERWWDSVFEQMDNPGSIFELILELMRDLREADLREESRETLLREAWMRQQVRKAKGEGFERIAVVCGAWHAPILDRTEDFSEKEDRALLRGLRKAKVAACWIPWSYERLAFSSGYAAGVISPAWYELLFRKRESLAANWMVRAGRLFRQERFEVSPAHIQEAVRLAEMLAALRMKSVPGIGELEEAAISVLCDGREERIALIRERLVIGTLVGKAPSEFATPLQQDLERCVKTARLSREFKSSERVRKELDLRIASNRAASQLIHRLHLLDIPWGEPGYARGESLGTFKEIWKLKWKPDYMIRLIQAGLWGVRIEEAALRRTLDRATRLNALPEALNLLWEVLDAALTEATAPLLQKIQVFAATTKEVDRLLMALPALARIIRYGDARGTDRAAIAALADEIIPRAAIGLPSAVCQISEEYAQEWFQLVLGAHHALRGLEDTKGMAVWYQALQELALNRQSNPLIAGLAVRLLIEGHVWPDAMCDMAFEAALSNATEPLQSAFWLEGFTSGPALVLLHTPGVWQRLDNWVRALSDEEFKQILPVLRRTFSRFSRAERRVLQQRVARGSEQVPDTGQPFNPQRLALIKSSIDGLLGK